VLGYAFFLSLMGLGTQGILVSFISTAIDKRIAALHRGETPVMERRHVLILGWNNKVFTVLQQLAHLEPKIKTVILAPMEMAMSALNVEKTFLSNSLRHQNWRA